MHSVMAVTESAVDAAKSTASGSAEVQSRPNVLLMVVMALLLISRLAAVCL